ncbi:TIGR00725 family protein [Altericista sp. CCNU0014]|uniref:TIGR00725 family protein n=1 Tax=Altericista sp. CCNU0014 TaxID=3082949 RepID=UPI00384AEA2F
METIVAVIGANNCESPVYDLAHAVGEQLARQGFTLICGGLGGVMTAACQGAKAAGGRTIGILPGNDPKSANAWVDVAIATGMGEARNTIIVNTAAALVAISGGYGTLSEIAFALRAKKPIIGLQSWTLSLPGETQQLLPIAITAEEAVAWVAAQMSL